MNKQTTSIPYLLLLFFLFCSNKQHLHVKATSPQLLKGFSATPDSSVSSFQSIITDPTGNFSLGFLRVNRSQLSLVVLHIPSSQPVWFANTTHSLRWSKPTQLSFNGSLVLSDSHTKVTWSTHTDGDHLLLLNNSNLQIQKTDDSHSVLWQSFDFPSDTLIENQNFTAQMTLVSSNNLFSMRLGEDYIGLYSNFERNSNHIYWRHKAMQAKADIISGKGPIYARISSHGFLGMYQTESAPADVLPFGTFQQSVSGIRKLKLESDGNLKAYYWNGAEWINDFTAITDQCELPRSCGCYGLCRPGNDCECLDNKTEYRTGECFSPESGDFCGRKKEIENEFWVLRRNGVELPHKELMGFDEMASLQDCEDSCQNNCSCWGAVFNNATKYCYKINYPINSLVAVGDEKKMGYFKVRRVAKKRNVGLGVGLLVGAVVLFVGLGGIGVYKIWKRKQRANSHFGDGISPGPYRDLGSASFRSIELSKS